MNPHEFIITEYQYLCVSCGTVTVMYAAATTVVCSGCGFIGEPEGLS